jgi:hypothetical protein
MANNPIYSWQSLVQLLSNDKKSSVKCLDTVFIDTKSKDLQWFFTSKSGSVSRKKKDSTSVESIVDRFSRFALSNPYNTDAIVGVLVDMSSSGRKQFRREELEQLLLTNAEELHKPGSFLQVYLRPFRGSDVLFSCESNRVDNLEYQHEIMIVHQPGSATDSSATTEVTDSIQSQMHTMSESIIKSLREVSSMVLDQLTIACIVDDNQHAWLSSITHCEVAVPEPDPGDKGNNANNAFDEAGRVEHHQENNISKSTGAVAENTKSPKKSPKKKAAAMAAVDNIVEAGMEPQENNFESNEPDFLMDPLQDPSNPYYQRKSVNTGQNAVGKGGGGKKGGAVDGDSKKKKNNNKNFKTGDSGFRRAAQDEPPSLDLLAKFAAEKERYDNLFCGI